MSKILHYILSYSRLGEFLNERKTVIGAALMVLSGALGLLDQLIPLFPDAAYLADARGFLKQALDASTSTLEALGYGFLTVGLVHKAAKKQLEKGK